MDTITDIFREKESSSSEDVSPFDGFETEVELIKSNNKETTDAVIIEYLKIFKSVDADGSKSIEKDELRIAFQVNPLSLILFVKYKKGNNWSRCIERRNRKYD